jgi:hypothetical protein
MRESLGTKTKSELALEFCVEGQHDRLSKHNLVIDEENLSALFQYAHAALSSNQSF